MEIDASRRCLQKGPPAFFLSYGPFGRSVVPQLSAIDRCHSQFRPNSRGVQQLIG